MNYKRIAITANRNFHSNKNDVRFRVDGIIYPINEVRISSAYILNKFRNVFPYEVQLYVIMHGINHPVKFKEATYLSPREIVEEIQNTIDTICKGISFSYDERRMKFTFEISPDSHRIAIEEGEFSRLTGFAQGTYPPFPTDRPYTITSQTRANIYVKNLKIMLPQYTGDQPICIIPVYGKFGREIILTKKNVMMEEMFEWNKFYSQCPYPSFSFLEIRDAETNALVDFVDCEVEINLEFRQN
jgi:hypothetical protein